MDNPQVIITQNNGKGRIVSRGFKKRNTFLCSKDIKSDKKSFVFLAATKKKVSFLRPWWIFYELCRVPSLQIVWQQAIIGCPCYNTTYVKKSSRK